MTTPQGVHLVGSVPLADETEVFHVVGHALGRHLQRIPDGETGERQQWVQFHSGRDPARGARDSVGRLL
jgi:hypothetical protein